MSRPVLLSYMTPGFPVSLFERIADTIGCTLELETSSSGPPPGDDPFADGRADFGWICSTSFVDLAMRGPDPSVEIVGVAWVPADPGSADRAQYHGDVVVPADSPILEFEDLRGATIGCNDEVSLSGHHALRFAIRSMDEDPADFAQLRFTGAHHTSLDRVIAGELDAAVVDSVVRSSRAGEPGVASLRIIERLGPWPTQPLVARRGLDPDLVAAVRQRLLASMDDPAMRRELEAAALSRFCAVDEDHYLPVRALLAQH